MAGVLQFALVFDGTERSTTSLTSTAQAFQAVANSATSTANPLATNADRTRSLGEAAKSTRASLAAMQSTLAIFGGSVAPQLSTAVLLITSQLGALKDVARATGLSFTTLGIAGAGLATSIYAISKAIQEYNAMREAQGGQKQSETNELASLEARRKKYIELSKTAEMFGTMTRKQMSDFMHGVLDAKTPEEQNAALNRWGKFLGEIGATPLAASELARRENYNSTLRMFEAQSQGGDAPARERIYQEAGRQLKEAFANNTSATPYEPMAKAIIAARDKALADLEKKPEVAAATVTSFEAPIRTPQVTDIERMGFVFNSGLNRGGNDFSRDTALNTRKTYEAVKALTDKVGGTTSNSFANQ